MTLTPYRAVLAIPGVTQLTLVALVARVPVTAAGVVLTLHVVLGLGQGYGPAGLVGAASTLGTALGAPFLGRVVDRYGLRRMLVITTLAEGAFWAMVPWLPYLGLLVASLVFGLLTLPVFSVVRQSLAALVPEQQRRTAYSLDSMSVELSFMMGPALGVLVATTVSTGAAALSLGAMIVASGTALYVLNPAVRGQTETDSVRPPVRSWLRRSLVAVLLATTATTLIVAGTDVAIVAALQSTGQVSWIGLVLVGWGLVSLVGGFIYGAMRRGVSVLLLAALMGLCTIPMGLFGNAWWVLALALVPAGLLCAPTLASLADAVSRLAPGSVRGLVMGLHSSALTAGFAIGAPLAGVVVDASSPSWAFAAAGTVGAALAAIAFAVQLSRREPVRLPVAEPVAAGSG